MTFGDLAISEIFDADFEFLQKFEVLRRNLQFALACCRVAGSWGSFFGRLLVEAYCCLQGEDNFIARIPNVLDGVIDFDGLRERHVDRVTELFEQSLQSIVDLHSGLLLSILLISLSRGQFSIFGLSSKMSAAHHGRKLQ